MMPQVRWLGVVDNPRAEVTRGLFVLPDLYGEAANT